MDKLEWTGAMATGIADIDQAHRTLLTQMKILLDGPDRAVASGMESLVVMLEQDFRAEEDLMEAIAFPGLQSHMEQHARVLAALHRLVPGDVAAAREALELLPQWFQLHLVTLDNALAGALKTAAALRRRA